ncbi:MAG: ATP-dependent 6-phosphofructokinase [Phycisphaerae bacterium]
MITPQDVEVSSLGPREVDSPLGLSTVYGDGMVNFVPEQGKTRFRVTLGPDVPDGPEVLFDRAGPRQNLFFDPARTSAAVVTCGGLCPGLNNVIRSIYLQLTYGYGVKQVFGIRYGFKGLHPNSGAEPFLLTDEAVSNIHRRGGTMLGSSRGPGDPETMVNFLHDRGIDILFCVGGDGTQRGAHAIATEVARQGRQIAVVGVPKTIDNDIMYVNRTFGFSTAVEQARLILDSAHAEATGAENGIALVKLMGRHAGFIAAAATVASQDVNFVLVPEVPFKLHGDNGFLEHLKQRLLKRRHAVIVVAEGAGQDLLADDSVERDASGNVKLEDIGPFMQRKILEYFKEQGLYTTVKYFDPSYAIRSTHADADDSVLCDQFARNAVHAAMAGYTDTVIGLWHGVFIHVPIGLATSEQKRMDVEGLLWRSALAATGQPVRFG